MEAPSLPLQQPVLPPSRSDAAQASSAHSRINIPLNLENWAAVPADTQAALLWFHQHALDERLTWKDCTDALGYDQSTVFRVLKGTYEGSWKNITAAIASYRRITEQRGTIQQNEFVENSIAKKIFDGLDYALANNSISIITGESRMGKTCAASAWKEANNHGRSVYVIAPAYGGTKALLRDIAAAVGVNRNLAATAMHEAILRAFNKNRILIVDEAHRLLPGDRRINPVSLEVLRDIHDRTGCGLALIATTRFDFELKKSDYMFEQILGRSRLVRLKPKIAEPQFGDILRQYIKRPTKQLIAVCEVIANERGRLGVLVECLKSASRAAAKAKRPLEENDVITEVKLRKQASGELPED